jgi:hypothetical protein
MSANYVIEPIRPRTMDKAYALARAMAPGVSRLAWRQVCQSCHLLRDRPDQKPNERIIVALNLAAYVKGLCVYTPRNHPAYGRMLDVPFFVTASAADNAGVAAALFEFLRAECERYDASCIRLWAMDADTWAQRQDSEHIARSDHGRIIPP